MRKGYVAVNENGLALIFMTKPTRCTYEKTKNNVFMPFMREGEKGFWGMIGYMDGYAKITKEKMIELVGKELTWEDEPFEVEY